MDFDFIPYRLNADIAYFKTQIQYISSDNGVDLYKAREKIKQPILGIPVTDVNLYFFEGNLITVYIHLAENPESFSQVRESLESRIKRPGNALETDLGDAYYWDSEREYLALIKGQKIENILLYYSLIVFNIFGTDFR